MNIVRDSGLITLGVEFWILAIVGSGTIGAIGVRVAVWLLV